MSSDVALTLQPVAVRRSQAAAAVAMSLRKFEKEVQPEIRMIRRGRLRLVPVEELQRWARENAA